MANLKNFEQSLKKLEKIVEEMESGELPLDQALKKFEAGVKLSRECSAILAEAEKRITMLTKDKEGNHTDVPFEDQDEL